mgnify:CR=1 FL=1
MRGMLVAVSAAPAAANRPAASERAATCRQLLLCAVLLQRGGPLPPPVVGAAVRALLPLAARCTEEHEREAGLCALFALLSLARAAPARRTARTQRCCARMHADEQRRAPPQLPNSGWLVALATQSVARPLHVRDLKSAQPSPVRRSRYRCAVPSFPHPHHGAQNRAKTGLQAGQTYPTAKSMRSRYDPGRMCGTAATWRVCGAPTPRARWLLAFRPTITCMYYLSRIEVTCG